MKTFLKELVVAFGLSLVWALAWFRPLLSRSQEQEGTALPLGDMFFSTTNPELLIGKGVDLFGSIWMIFQTREMVNGAPSKLSEMYYPVGFDLGQNTGYAWFDALLGVPLLNWIGNPGFWNVHVLMILTLSLAALMILFRQFQLSWWLTVPLALLCFTNPFMIDELNLGRPTQIFLLPLALLLAVFVKIPTRGFVAWHGVLAGVFMSMACLTYWFTGIATGVCLVFWYLWLLFRQENKREGVLFGVLGVVTVSVIILSVTWPMSSRILSGQMQYSYKHLLGRPDHVYAMTSLALQTEYSISSLKDLIYVFKASCQYLPFFIVIVGTSFAAWGRTVKMPLVALWIFTLGMSLSSGLNIFGVHIPTGLAVLEWVFPPMLRCQFEGRNVVVANLLGCMIVAYTFSHMKLLSRVVFSKVQSQHLLGVFLCGFAVYLLPTTQSLAVTEFVKDQESNQLLKSNPGAILELPLMASNYTFVQQMYHHQPIFGGMGFDTVRPLEHKRYTKGHPSIDQMLTVLETGYFNKPLSSKHIQYLLEDGFRWVVIYPGFTETPLERWSHLIGVTGVEIDGKWFFDLKSVKGR